MFEQPTINDYLDQLLVTQEESVLDFGKQKASIQAKAAAAGAFQSSRTILLILDAMDSVVKNGALKMLAGLRRATRSTELDPRELRNLTAARIEELTSAVVNAANWNSAGSWIQSNDAMVRIDERIAELKRKVHFWIRQFDIGFDHSPEPESLGQVTNILNAGDITGPVQQGQGTLTQNAHVHIDIAAAGHAVDDLERELPNLMLADEVRGELEGDLATIKAQLRKSSPSAAILREAGRSVRSITEGVLAGVFTPQGVVAIAMLANALGI